MKLIGAYVRSFDWEANMPLSRKKTSAILLEIWTEYDCRLTAKVSFYDGSNTRNESAKNFLRREIYALGWRMFLHPPSWRIEEFVNDMRDTRTTRPDALSNIFHALLMCVYNEDTRISRHERSLMAGELEYARRHEVPPSLLCGFLYQSTDRKRISERLKANFIEPAFE